MAIFKDDKNKDANKDAKAKKEGDKDDTGLAESTHPRGAQSTDPGRERALPRSSPEEVAPIPDASGTTTTDGNEPEAAESGYRVKAGKAVNSITGDVIDGGQEISEKHVPGGQARLDELEKAGYIEKVRRGRPESQKGDDGEDLPPLHGVDGTKPAQEPAEPGTPEAGTKPGDKPTDQQPLNRPGEPTNEPRK